MLTGISGKSCTWSPPGSFGSDASLLAALYPGTLADQEEYFADFPGGIEDITVGGQPGLLRVSDEPWRSGIVFADAMGEVLQFQWDDYEGLAPDADVAAGLRQVTEEALPRMSTITFAEPTQVPMPSFRTDADLAAMFPATIGGQPVTVNTMYYVDLLAAMGSTDDEAVQRIQDALAPEGRSIDDITFGQAYVATDPPANVGALRITGADARALEDSVLQAINQESVMPAITQGQVAGRDVRILTPAEGPVSYVYTSGDVIWLVQAEEPVLSEVIGALP